MSKLTKKQAGLLVQTARKSLRALDPSSLATSIQNLLADDAWREYLSPLDLQLHTWESFPKFVEEELETTGESLVKALHNFPRIAAEVADRLAAPVGGTATRSSVTSLGSQNTGMKMRRLIKHRPDLAAQVEAGALSVSRAFELAGWEQPKLRVPTDIAGFALWGVRRFGREPLLRAVAEAQEETRECVICGKRFAPGGTGRRQVTCGAPECQKKREASMHRQHAARNPEKRREAQRRYRARKKAEKEAQT